jgi:hypothetical protein
LEAGVTAANEREQMIAALLVPQASDTAELNPFNELTMTVVEVLLPATVTAEAGLTDTEKLFTFKV